MGWCRHWHSNSLSRPMRTPAVRSVPGCRNSLSVAFWPEPDSQAYGNVAISIPSAMTLGKRADSQPRRSCGACPTAPAQHVPSGRLGVHTASSASSLSSGFRRSRASTRRTSCGLDRGEKHGTDDAVRSILTSCCSYGRPCMAFVRMGRHVAMVDTMSVVPLGMIIILWIVCLRSVEQRPRKS